MQDIVRCPEGEVQKLEVFGILFLGKFLVKQLVVRAERAGPNGRTGKRPPDAKTLCFLRCKPPILQCSDFCLSRGIEFKSVADRESDERPYNGWRRFHWVALSRTLIDAR